MRNNTTVFVGLDIHKESIVAAYAIGSDEPQDLGNIGVLQRDLDRLCTRMHSKGSAVHFLYEAGPCGYAVYRYLTAKGFDCTVCAPSLIARKPGDRVKTDRRDAQKLLKALRMNDLSAVHVPDAADEAFRDLVRAWGAARQDLKQAKQRLKSFLLVHDVRYTGKANWNEAHRRWLAKFVFPHPNSHLAFQEHLHSIDDRLTQWRFYPLIQALQAMRGIQFTVAVGLLAEIGEFSRFDTPRQLMAWLGLVPSEYSSGLRKRHEGIPRSIVDRAWDAQLRLCKRFRKLTARGKPHSVALVAVARELSGFIWDIARLATPASSTH